jgi:hypothetical protein
LGVKKKEKCGVTKDVLLKNRKKVYVWWFNR